MLVHYLCNKLNFLAGAGHIAGIFLAHLIANIRSYSHLKIVYNFPNPQEKIPKIGSYKIKILNNKFLNV
jgi:hypothetical protein